MVDRVRRAAAARDRSVNDYVSAVLDAATDPALAGDEAARLRELLARAGLLAPTGAARRRPPAEQAGRARSRAGRGTPLSDIVSGDR